MDPFSLVVGAAAGVVGGLVLYRYAYLHTPWGAALIEKLSAQIKAKGKELRGE